MQHVPLPIQRGYQTKKDKLRGKYKLGEQYIWTLDLLETIHTINLPETIAETVVRYHYIKSDHPQYLISTTSPRTPDLCHDQTEPEYRVAEREDMLRYKYRKS